MNPLTVADFTEPKSATESLHGEEITEDFTEPTKAYLYLKEWTGR